MTDTLRRPTVEQAAWLKSFLGIDISLHPDYAAAGVRTVQTQAGPPIGQAAPPDPALAKRWTDQNKAAMDALATAVYRVVMPGPAAQAQARLVQALNAVKSALAAGTTDAATAALAAAQKDVKLVMAQQDAALLPVTPAEHADQILFGKETPSLAIQKASTDENDIELSDVRQHGVGDCFMLSVLADVAKIKPEMIRGMIKPGAAGVYTVTFYKRHGFFGRLFAMLSGSDQFEPVQVTVDSNFGTNTANSGPGEAQVGNQHEVWVQVVEKAFAKLNGGYDKITGGGYPQDAMETVTGKPAGSSPLANVSAGDLQAALASHKPVVMSTMVSKAPNRGLPNHMVGSHAYVMAAIQTGPDGQPVVILKNPWGFNDPPPIPLRNLGQSVGWVQIGSGL